MTTGASSGVLALTVVVLATSVIAHIHAKAVADRQLQSVKEHRCNMQAIGRINTTRGINEHVRITRIGR